MKGKSRTYEEPHARPEHGAGVSVESTNVGLLQRMIIPHAPGHCCEVCRRLSLVVGDW